MIMLAMLGTACSPRREIYGIPLTRVITKNKGLGSITTFLICDYAGENAMHLIAVCSETAITMEMAAPYIPQMNGVVER
jgi:hypothetical protein